MDDGDGPKERRRTPVLAQRAAMTRARIAVLVLLTAITVLVCAGIAWEGLRR